jgi:hypothetical protein
MGVAEFRVMLRRHITLVKAKASLRREQRWQLWAGANRTDATFGNAALTRFVLTPFSFKP